MTHKEIIEEANRRYVGCHSNPSDASKHDGFVKGAIWANEQIIEHACEWLRKIGAFSTLSFHDEEGVSQDVYEDMFRKAMEEQG